MNLSAETMNELSNVDNLDFNIFKLKELTKGNELLALSTYLMQTKSLFSTQKINTEVFN
jgi:hypothetical protein